MYDLVILLSRYLFIFYIVFFAMQSVRIFLGESGMARVKPYLCYSYQRVTTVFMHLTAFIILSYNNGRYSFKLEGLILCGVGLLFICAAPWIWEKVYQYSNRLMWNTIVFFMDVSIIMLYRLNPQIALRQACWIGIGFLLSLVIPAFMRIIRNPEKLRVLYVILIFGLIFLPFFAGNEEYGSLNWIKIGSVSFQPSEVVKFLFVFYLASRFKEKINIIDVIASGIVMLGIAGSMVYQNDLGGALIFFVVYVVSLYCASGHVFWLAGGFVFLLGAVSIAFKLFHHVKLRVNTWHNPWTDPSGGGYQIIQSLFAIASWGFLGRGLGRGVPGKIPVVERDMIFSAICEEFGSFFGICMIALFATFFYMGIKISLKGRKHFNVMLALGFTVLLSFQFFLIIGGVTKLIPLTGVTMPFVSYGGTSVIVCLLITGILQWLHGQFRMEEIEEEDSENELNSEENIDDKLNPEYKAGDLDEIEEIH